VTLSVVAPDGGLALVSQVDAPAQLRPQSWVGQRFPLHTSASGKVLLSTYDDERLEHFLVEPLTRFTPSTITTADGLVAELQRVREQRYAVTSDEEEEGLCGIATGLRGQDGELLGVLTVSGPTQRLDGERRRNAAGHLLRAAGHIEAALRRGTTSAAVLEVMAQPGG
jgi:DNA-binding IclR family transcriptional regulator